MNRSRVVIVLLIAGLIAAFFVFDLERFFSLETLKSEQARISAFRNAHPSAASISYVVIYVAVAALSLPGAAVLTLAGGAIFGLLWGTVLASFASSIGATLAFLAARFLLRDVVQGRFGERLKGIEAGIAKEGAFYLFTLRLIPVFPFFLVNLAVGLTGLPVLTFYWVSQLGMLAGTLVYMNAGTELAKIDSLSGILSPRLL